MVRIQRDMYIRDMTFQPCHKDAEFILLYASGKCCIYFFVLSQTVQEKF
jgi:hypothetical protein